MRKFKNTFITIFCLLISCLIVLGLKYYHEANNLLNVIAETDKSILQQNITHFSLTPTEHSFIYYKGKLLAVINDDIKFQKRMQKLYQTKYAAEFPATSLTLGPDYYLESEQNYNNYEDIDDQIFNYLLGHKGFGLIADYIDFYNGDTLYASIAVKNLADFETAERQFLEFFIDPQDLQNLLNTNPADLTDFGSQVVGFKILERITPGGKRPANPEDIIKDAEGILRYLCYGERKELDYHTVKEGETLQTIAFRYDLHPLQRLVNINHNVLFSREQALEPGMKLNVTYFESPITVIVNKRSLREEKVDPPAPILVPKEDEYVGYREEPQPEQQGIDAVLYRETWVNGVLREGVKESSSTIRAPIQGITLVGTMPKPSVGTGTFMVPILHPALTSPFGPRPELAFGYHYGIDLIDIYTRYGPIFAADNGVVIAKGINDVWRGNYLVIDHNNGFRTKYFHLSKFAPDIEEGTVVMKGDYIGNIGATGYAFGAHLHFEIVDHGVRYDPCNYLNGCRAFISRW